VILGESVEIISGYAFKSEFFNQKGEGTPIIRIRDVGGSQTETYYTGDFLEEFIVQKGDFLVAMDGEFRLAEWKGGKALLNQRVCKIVPKSGVISSRYLLHILPKELKLIEDTTPFVTVKHLSVKKIKEIQIPLPPLPTQQKIAAILDKAQSLCEIDRQIIQKYNQLAQSLFLDMFGDPVTNPKEWEIKQLGDVCEKITDGTHHSPPNTDEGIPYVTAKHVKPFKVDFESNPTYISYEDHREIYKRCDPKNGDVLYIKDGATTGIAVVNSFDFEFSMLSSLALLRTNRQLLEPQYLCFWLNHDTVKSKIITRMVGGAIKRLTLKNIKPIPILIPSIQAQRKFSKSVNEINSQKQLAQQSLQKSEDLFQSLLQSAFAGGFGG